jgi:putative DNA primase/helicase
MSTDTEHQEKQRKAVLSHALKSESEARIRAAVKLAATMPDLVVRHDELDADPDLFNVANGTLHLPSGELRPHDRTDLLTLITNVPWLPHSEAPTFRAFLKRVTRSRAELASYLQRATGYTLTGRPREHVVQMMYGDGANGKTTYIETMRALFGEYGQQTPASTFLERRDGIPSDVARLDGARFVSAVEMPDGRRLNETLVKRLTGGDTITARYLHREWFEFQPRFVPWIATNHKPTVRGTDEAIWRRIRLIPFDVEIPAAERDSELLDKLRAELPGILLWALEGHDAYLRRGLDAPSEVLAAIDEYRKEQDLVGRFIEECCTRGDDLRAKPAALYRAFSEYVGSGERVASRTFYSELQRRGFEPARDARGRWYLGLELADGENSLFQRTGGDGS